MAVRVRRGRTGSVVAAGFVLCALSVLTAQAAPFGTAEVPEPGPRNSYLVTFRAGTHPSARQDSREKVTRSGGAVSRTYSRAFAGFAGDMSPAVAADLRADPDVLRVSPDAPVRATGGVQPLPPWNLDRIDQRSRTPASNSYTWDGDGSGVTVYVVDTGIRADSAQLTGRVGPGFTALDDGHGTGDCSGHGTHVAGIVAGTDVGVAKGATVVPVRVLHCDGSGIDSDVIAGLDWVLGNAVPGRSVVNLSLGGSVDPDLDAAVNSVINAGIPVVVAAGNGGGDACLDSPARVPGAITVGAVDATDARAAFSNSGSCVDLFAPGVNILSAWPSSATATAVLSGTSQASPHVAGELAVLLQAAPGASPAALWSALNGFLTRGVLTGLGSGSPNSLLFAPPRHRLAGAGSSTVGPFLAAAGGDPAALAVGGAGVIDAFDVLGSSTVAAQDPATAPRCSIARPASQAAARAALVASLTAADGCLQFAGAENPDLSAASPQLVYIPVARDHVTFAITSTSNVPHNLSLADLRAMYRCDLAAGSAVRPMVPTAGSGLREFWLGLVYPGGVPNPLPSCVEDGADEFGVPIAPNSGAQVDNSEIAPYSMAQWTTQSVGFAPARLGRVVVGTIDGLNPFAVNFGVTRELYAVIPATALTGTSYDDLRLREVFVGPGSRICSAVAGPVGRKYDVDPDANCGSTSLHTG